MVTGPALPSPSPLAAFMQREGAALLDVSSIAHCRDEGLQVRLNLRIQIRAHLTPNSGALHSVCSTMAASRLCHWPLKAWLGKVRGKCNLTSLDSPFPCCPRFGVRTSELWNLLGAAACLAVSGHQVEPLNHFTDLLVEPA